MCEYVNNHKDENKMKLFNKLPLEINDFVDITPLKVVIKINKADAVLTGSDVE